MKNFIEELEWRGMIHTIMPGPFLFCLLFHNPRFTALPV